MTHLPWCSSHKEPTCDCAQLQKYFVNLRGGNVDGSWQPNRNPVTETGPGWQAFVETCGLSHWPESERTMLRGQDGWAFGTAIRFQAAAYELAKTDEQRFWSSYYLLSRIIERARTDMTFLEAIEALAVAHLYGGLSKSQVTQQFRSLGVWP